MFWDDKKRALVRAAVGGLIGVAVLIPLGGLFNDLVSGGLISMGFHTPFRLVSADLEWRVGSAPLAFVIQLALYFLLGAAAGVSTLPFADDGPTLVLRSLAHFALTAGLVYRIKHSRAGALISCVASIAVITIVGALANYFLLLPFYASAYMPYDAIIAACQAINPAITDIKGYILFGVVPFNLLKGTVVAIITFAVYKRLSGVFHRWMEASQPRKA